MKRLLVVIVFCTYVVSVLHAQVSLVTSFRIALPDTSGRQFFNRNTGIQGLLVEFEQEKPVSVSLYQDKQLVYNAIHPVNEFYDLKFEGDKYLLKKKYEQIPIPALPALRVGFFAGIGKFKTRYDVKAAVYRDSVAYVFDVWSYPDTSGVFFWKMSNVAGYKRNISTFSRRLERIFQKTAHASVTDSVLIFRGIVERDGSLIDVELIEGNSNSFAEFIHWGLKESGRVWFPGHQGGTPLRSYVRIYARLHADQRITLEVSGRNR